MNRTSFFGRLGAVLAAPIATPLAKALAPTSAEAPMIGRMAQGTGMLAKAESYEVGTVGYAFDYGNGITSLVRVGTTPSIAHLAESPFSRLPEVVTRIWDGTRWLPPANTLP